MMNEKARFDLTALFAQLNEYAALGGIEREMQTTEKEPLAKMANRV